MAFHTGLTGTIHTCTELSIGTSTDPAAMAQETERPDSGPAAPRLLRHADLRFLPRFAHGETAEIAEVTGTALGTRLGTGFARFRGASIPWTTRYDEVILVLEGALSVTCGGVRFEAGPGDTVWLPAGTALVYESAAALVFYAIWPADWAASGEGAA